MEEDLTAAMFYRVVTVRLYASDQHREGCLDSV
jgi:hypothetical protein